MEVTTTTPLEPCPTLPGGHGKKFPIENRIDLGEPQVGPIPWSALISSFVTGLQFINRVSAAATIGRLPPSNV